MTEISLAGVPRASVVQRPGGPVVERESIEVYCTCLHTSVRPRPEM